MSSELSSSEVQLPSGSFGFVPGWTDPMWLLWLRACKRVHGSTKTCCHRENSQAGYSPIQSTLSHTLLSSTNRAPSISSPDWAETDGARRRGWAHYHLVSVCWGVCNVWMASRHRAGIQHYEMIFSRQMKGVLTLKDKENCFVFFPCFVWFWLDAVSLQM